MMKSWILLVFAFLLVSATFGQENLDDESPATHSGPIFKIVQKMPNFPGGQDSLHRYLASNTMYPQTAIDANISGKVFVTFVVEADGSLSDVKVLRGIGGGCDEEAVRVVKAMPAWQPGMQGDNPVRVQFNLPVRFVSESDASNDYYIEPQYNGGMLAYFTFLQNNLYFPKAAKKKGLQNGKAVVTFDVDVEGTISNIEAASSEKSFAKEAKRVFELMPNWKPAKRNGIAVKARHKMTVAFTR